MPAFAYEGVDGKREVLFGTTAALLDYWPKVDGIPVDPADGQSFITIRSASDVELVARIALTESEPVAGTKRLRYTLNASNKATFPLGEDYEARIEFKVGTDVYEDEFRFDIVRTPLPPLVGPNDLKELEPGLEELITDLGAGDAQRFIALAHARVLKRIRQQGRRPALITGREELVETEKHLALHFLWRALVRARGDVATEQAEYHEQQADDAWPSVLRYDAGDTGGAGTDVHLNRVRITLR